MCLGSFFVTISVARISAGNFLRHPKDMMKQKVLPCLRGLEPRQLDQEDPESDLPKIEEESSQGSPRLKTDELN